MTPPGGFPASKGSVFACASRKNFLLSPRENDLVRGRVCWRCFKPDHRFIRFGVAEFFAGKAFDGFRVVEQRINLCLKLLRFSLFYLDLLLQLENLRAHPGVFLNERQITHPNQ
jgi:hypothetical protein